MSARPWLAEMPESPLSGSVPVRDTDTGDRAIVLAVDPSSDKVLTYWPESCELTWGVPASDLRIDLDHRLGFGHVLQAVTKWRHRNAGYPDRRARLDALLPQGLSMWAAWSIGDDASASRLVALARAFAAVHASRTATDNAPPPVSLVLVADGT